MSNKVGGPGLSYYDAPETVPYDGHNAPETIQYDIPEVHDQKPLEAMNPRIMEVGLGPRRLGDMKASKFWIILGFICALVIAATVGGAVGGSLAARKDHGNSSASSTTSSSTLTALGTSSSTQSSSSSLTTPSPTTSPTPSSNCQNGTTYDSLFKSGSNGAVPDGAGLTFTRLCGGIEAVNNIGSAYVYSLDDCIEVCAGLNFWPGDRRCSSVTYSTKGIRPVNCWAHDETLLGRQKEDSHMAVLQ